MKKSTAIFFLTLLSSLSYSQGKIFSAIKKGDIQYISEYIAKGKDLNVTVKEFAKDDYTKKKISYSFEILEYAATHADESIISLFLNNKDRFNNFQVSLNKAFAASISGGNMKVIKLLLDSGADINAICQICYGQVAIQTALEYSNFELFNYLLQKGADLNVHNSFNRTLLHSVAHTHNSEAAKLLIEKGLDLNAVDNDGATPLIYAASNGDLAMFKLLIDNGAILMTKEFDNSDVLMSAVENNNLDLINFILDKGFDINQKNNDDDTPLIFAASSKQPQVVSLLISKGGDINHVNKKGETALLWAIWNNDVETARILIEKGADITFIDYLKPSKKYINDPVFIQYLKEKIKAKLEYL